jgi:hypothetical protein
VALSVFSLVLLIPQRVVEIEDTLTESGAARVDTDIGASQARLPLIGLIGVLDCIGAAASHQQCCKRANQDDARHCYLQSELYQVELGFASVGSGDCRIATCIHWGSFYIYNADCESRRTRPEPLLIASGSIRRHQFALIQLRQGLIEASDAGVVKISRLMEPHDDCTGVVLTRCSRVSSLPGQTYWPRQAARRR